MISRFIVTSVLATISSLFLANAAVTGYDNGGPNLIGGFEIIHYRTANSFTLSADVVVNGIKFWDLEENTSLWANLIFWEIRANAPNNSPGAVLFSGNSMNLTHVATGRNFQPKIPEFVDSFDIPSIALPSGTYWLVLHNGPLSNNEPGATTIYWETTTSNRTDPSYTDEAIQGSFNNAWQADTPGSPSQLAFQLSGIVRPKVMTFGFLSGSPRVSFTTVIGQNYRVEYKNNLNDTFWTIVSGASNVSGTGNVVQVNDPDPNLPNIARRVYRVTVL